MKKKKLENDYKTKALLKKICKKNPTMQRSTKPQTN